jgi:hypothetical protein
MQKRHGKPSVAFFALHAAGTSSRGIHCDRWWLLAGGWWLLAAGCWLLAAGW